MPSAAASETGTADGQVVGLETPERGHKVKTRKVDWYFAPKYQSQVWPQSLLGGVNLEGGMIWGKGLFWGFDAGFSTRGGLYGTAGFGLSLGNVYDLGHELQLVYGGSVGFWFADGEFSENDEYKTDEMADYCYYNEQENFFGPFVKLRWKRFELTYRGLWGHKNESYRYDDGNYFNHHYVTVDEGFGWNSHQLMLGFYFSTSKRGTPKKVKVKRRVSPAPPDWLDAPVFAPTPAGY
jgi:hypothetical protein